MKGEQGRGRKKESARERERGKEKGKEKERQREGEKRKKRETETKMDRGREEREIKREGERVRGRQRGRTTGIRELLRFHIFHVPFNILTTPKRPPIQNHASSTSVTRHKQIQKHASRSDLGASPCAWRNIL